MDIIKPQFLANIDFKPDEIEKAISLIHSPGEGFEVRLISKEKDAKQLHGYFNTGAELVKGLEAIKNSSAPKYEIYQTVNPIKKHITVTNRFTDGATTKDADIEKYRCLIIDIDRRKSDENKTLSATDEEIEHCRTVADKVKMHLTGLGYDPFIEAFSGNGLHLVYPIDLPNDYESKYLIGSVLSSLNNLYSDEYADIDISVKNQARVLKLWGAKTCKGTESPDRPHRFSRIENINTNAAVIPAETLEEIGEAAPSEYIKKDQQQPANAENQKHNIAYVNHLLDKHGVSRKETTQKNGALRFTLEHCFFGENHSFDNEGCAAIFVNPSGLICYHCFHNSCSGKHWTDAKDALDQMDSIEYEAFTADKTAAAFLADIDSKGKLQDRLPEITEKFKATFGTDQLDAAKKEILECASKVHAKTEVNKLLAKAEADCRVNVALLCKQISVNGLSFKTPFWPVEVDGTYYADEHGRHDPVLISTSFFAITEKMVSKRSEDGDGTAYYNILYGHDYHAPLSMIIPKADLTDATKLKAYGRYDGFDVHSENVKMMVRYFSAFEAANRALIREVDCTDHMGWSKKKDSFYPYVDGCRLIDQDAGNRSIWESVCTHGDHDGQIAFLREIYENDKNNYIRFAMTAAVASLIKGYASESGQGFVVHFFGGSGFGKTVCTLELIASLFGDPDGGLIGNYDATFPGIEGRAAFLNNFPVLLDEGTAPSISIIKNGGVSNLIYSLANGKSKTRGTAVGKSQKIKHWNNVIISTGEFPLTGDNDFKGAENRTLNIHVKEKFCDDFSEFIRKRNENYGFFGRDVVQRIQQIGLEGVKSMIDRHQTDITEKAISRKTGKQNRHGAFLLAADEIITGILECNEHLTAATVLPYLIDEKDLNNPEQDYDRLAAYFLVTNKKNMISGMEYTPPEVWGKIYTDEKTKEKLWCVTIRAMHEATKHTLKIDCENLLGWAVKNDRMMVSPAYFTEDRSGVSRYQKTVKGMGRCYVFKVPEIYQ